MADLETVYKKRTGDPVNIEPGNFDEDTFSRTPPDSSGDAPESEDSEVGSVDDDAEIAYTYAPSNGAYAVYADGEEIAGGRGKGNLEEALEAAGSSLEDADDVTEA